MIETLVQDANVQFAVVVSGLLTLVILVIQGIRYLLWPFMLIVRKGWREARRIQQETLDKRVAESVSNGVAMTGNAIFLLSRLILAAANVALASTLTVIVSLQYIPGYDRQKITPWITFNVSPNLQVKLSAILLAISVLLLMLSSLSAMKFVSAIRSRAKLES